MAANEKLIQELHDKYVTVLQNMFELLDHSLSGHTGGSMSMLDIIIALYFHMSIVFIFLSVFFSEFHTHN